MSAFKTINFHAARLDNLIPQKIVNAVVPRSDVDNLKVKNLPPHYTNPLKRHQSLFETVARLVKKLEAHNHAFISVLHDDNHKEYICPTKYERAFASRAWENVYVGMNHKTEMEMEMVTVTLSVIPWVK
jgi:hypothetical protein